MSHCKRKCTIQGSVFIAVFVWLLAQLTDSGPVLIENSYGNTTGRIKVANPTLRRQEIGCDFGKEYGIIESTGPAAHTSPEVSASS